MIAFRNELSQAKGLVSIPLQDTRRNLRLPNTSLDSEAIAKNTPSRGYRVQNRTFRRPEAGSTLWPYCPQCRKPGAATSMDEKEGRCQVETMGPWHMGWKPGVGVVTFSQRSDKCSAFQNGIRTLCKNSHASDSTHDLLPIELIHV